MMTFSKRARLYTRILWELIRYDLWYAWRGMRGVRPKQSPIQGSAGREAEVEICEALRALAPFYWKPIRCLQRSIVTARVMRGRGIPAEVVIGYRAAPFLGHAWVEVAGRVANDSQLFQTRFLVLERL
jgi:hypothetical protein